VPNAMTPEAGACAAADMGIAMIESTRHFRTSDGQALQIRVGLHSGPVVAAVIGMKMPHYW
jgi:class 3 adenylate cyclase